jgi:hypothetical protein
VSPKDDWAITDLPTHEQALHILHDLTSLREAIKLWHSTPDVPGAGRPWNAEECNNIERILLDIDAMAQIILDDYYFECGELYAGEV